jgi:hypothetical protein
VAKGQKETFRHILTKQTEASIFAVNSPSGTQLIDLQIEHAVEGKCREEKRYKIAEPA